MIQFVLFLLLGKKTTILKDPLWNKHSFLDLAESVGCEQAGMKIMYDEDPEYVIDEIRELFRYDIVDDNRLILDSGDLAVILRPDYLSGILDDDGLFEDWFAKINWQLTI